MIASLSGTLESVGADGAVIDVGGVGYLAFWGVTNTGVTISWSTDVNANTVVAYGTSPALGQIYNNTSAGSTSARTRSGYGT